MKFDGFELSFESLPRRAAQLAGLLLLTSIIETLTSASSSRRRVAAPCRHVAAGHRPVLHASSTGSGTPTRIGAVTVPGAVGGEPIVAG